MDTEHVTSVCTRLGSLREDLSGRDMYVKHTDCLGMRRESPKLKLICILYRCFARFVVHSQVL